MSQPMTQSLILRGLLRDELEVLARKVRKLSRKTGEIDSTRLEFCREMVKLATYRIDEAESTL